MSDTLFIWAAQQDWGTPLNKLVMLFIAQDTDEAGGMAYGVTEDRVMAWAEMGRAQVNTTLGRLIARGHIVLASGRRGPGFMIGQLFRGEPIVLRMGEQLCATPR